VTCVKGKEKQAVGELYEIFEKVALDVWPELDTVSDALDDEEQDGKAGAELDLEKQIAKEMEVIKRPRKEQRFVSCQTNTPCVIFISCKPPVDPVELILRYVQNVEDTGVTHTRYTLRLTPVINTCTANLPEITSLFQRALKTFTELHPEHVHRKYKIELRMRNHNSLARKAIIDAIVELIPEGWTVDLEDPEAFVLVEVFKSVAGISIVTDYYKRQKFNVMEIAKSKGVEDKFEANEGRVVSHS